MHLSVTVREHGGYPLHAVAAPEPLPPEGGGAALTSPAPATAANKQSLFISASFVGASRRVKAPTLLMPWPLNDPTPLWLQPRPPLPSQLRAWRVKSSAIASRLPSPAEGAKGADLALMPLPPVLARVRGLTPSHS